MRRTRAFLAALVLLATSATSVLPAGATDGSCPDGQSCVVVNWTGAGTGSHTFDLNELNDLVAQGSVQYSLCNPDALFPCPPNDPGATDAIPCGVPIRALVGALGSGLGPDAVKTVTVHGTGSLDDAMLSSETHDLALDTDPLFPFIDTDRFSNKLYPIVGMNTSNLDDCSAAQSLTFIRPQRDKTDDNFKTYFLGGVGQSLQMDVVFDHVILHPTITLPSASIKAGSSVTFTADLPDGSPGAPTYDWYPTGDGDAAGTGPEKSFTYTYDVPGRYTAYVVANAGLGATGKSNEIIVSVGPKPTPTSGSSTPAGHGTGSNQNPSNGPVSGSGLHGGAAPTTQVSGPHGPAAPHSGDHGQNGSASASGGTGTESPSAPVHGEDGYIAVRGLLLDPNAVPLPGATTASRHPEAAPAARRGASGDTESSGLSVGVVAAAAGMLLLVLGALGECRRPARSRPRRARP